MDGDSIRGEDLLMMARGSGHMTLPAGVQVRVSEGAFKYRAPAGGRSAVGSSHGAGYRAPPPTRVSYAGSSTPSNSYRGEERGSMTSRETFRPSPPRDQAGFSRAGTHVGSYVTAARVPLPKSMAGTRSRAGASDWEVVQQEDDTRESWDDGRSSVAPSESISSVGSRGQRSSYNY